MKKIALSLSLGLCSGLLHAGESRTMADHTNSGRIFKDWSYDFQDNGTFEANLDLRGRLYVPPDYDPADTTTKYPLVVYYHGNHGSTQPDNQSHIANDPTKVLEAAQQHKFFVYLPHAPKNGWYEPGGIYLDNSMLQVANLLRAYRIDPEKVSLTGFSMGGNAVWSLGGIHAGAIAAAFPVEPNRGGLADINAQSLVGKPVWVFYNREDRASSTIHTEARGRVSQLRTVAGLQPWTLPPMTATADTDVNYFNEENGLRYSEAPNDGLASPSGAYAGHSTRWAYQKPELYTWLLAKSNTTGWLNEGETIKVDFGSQFVASGTAMDTLLNANKQTYLRPDSQGNNWNSTAAGYGSNFNAAVPFAKTTTGRGTFVSVHVLDKFAGDYNWSGTASMLYDANIARDGWITGAGTIGKILVRGLEPQKSYRVEVFATGTSSALAYRSTLYEIGTQVNGLFQTGSQKKTLTVYNNTSEKTVFPTVNSDANGELVLEVSGDANASSVYGMIGTLEITKGTPPPVDPSVALQSSGTIIRSVMNPNGGGSKNPEIIRDGIKPPVGSTGAASQYDTYTSVTPRIAEQHFGYVFASPKAFTKVVFQEGMHFYDGGWFNDGTLRIQVRRNGNWVDVSSAASPAYPIGSTKAAFGSNFETYTFPLNNETGDGIRIIGTVGGTNQFMSIAELEVFGVEAPTPVALQSSGTIIGSVTAPQGSGSKVIGIIRDGVKPPEGSTSTTLQYDTYTNVTPRIAEQHYGYEFDSNKVFTKLVFQEGKHFTDGGWFKDGTLRVQVRRGGNWVDVTPASVSPEAYPNANTQAAFGATYQTYTFTLNYEPGDGIRIIGMVGGSAQFTSIAELEAWGY